MKYYICLLFFSFIILNSSIHAQYFDLSPDALKVLLKDQTISKEDRVIVLKELAYRNKNVLPKDALMYVGQSLKLAKAINYKKGIAESTHTLGLIQFYLGDYELALSNYLIALEIRKEINDKIGLGRSYNNIGVFYQKMNKFDLAKNYFRQGLILRRETKDSVGIAFSYNNLGRVYLDQGNPKKAVTNYKIGLLISKKLKNAKAQSLTLSNLGDLYKSQFNYDKALRYYEETLELMIPSKNSYNKARILIKIGNIKIHQKDFETALINLKKGQEISEKLQAKPLLNKAYQKFSEAYAGIEDYEMAYNYQLKSKEIQKNLMTTSISNEILALEAKYQFEQKERKLLEQEGQIADLYRMFSILVFLVILVFSVLIYSRYRKQIKVNQNLKATAIEIKDKNKQLATYTKELEQFTYIASHDLKEPLRNIGGFARILDRRYRMVLDDKGKEYLNFIMTGVNQMTALLTDLLQYSEVKRLKEEDLKWVNLNDLMLSIQNSLNTKIQESNGRLIFNDLPMIYSNTFQIAQLFKNLISNGLKFQRKDDTPIIEVSGKHCGDFWEFKVTDNGIGIDKSYHDKIFEMFRRLHKQTDYEGTGMGLTICKQIIEQHGGEISIESKIEKGTTFIFTFPEKIIQ
jgi:signal transduction histidine kinase